MTNRLIEENSPYLLQHAENPVDWYPWGDEALDKARHEDKPIFLSIGYAACHWCHVMAHESFEDTDTAVMMNENFINIKVDREERPDLDSIYMKAVVAMTGQGGWPMSVFLTPEGVPFFSGTYFPPTRRYNMPSFREVLGAITRLWREDRPRLLQSAQEIYSHLRKAQTPDQASQPLQSALVEQAADQLAQTYDWRYGGWGQAPKFPQPMAIEFMLRRAARGDKTAHDITLHILDAMARGGIYDVIGGGFSRYSTDDHWLVPHFEKMLYDNAQLAGVYLQAYMLTGKPAYRQVCEETLDFVARELLDPSGGFYSSLDADSDGEEGKYYVWSLDEIQSVLSSGSRPGSQPDVFQFFAVAYNLQASGNFEGRNVLQRNLSDEALAAQFNLSVDQVSALLSETRAKLLVAREKRVRPSTDDKVLVAWNAFALKTFAEAARYLQRADYLTLAKKNAGFILEHLYPGRVLYRSWRRGKARHRAYLEDYAALILALIALYQSDPDLRWYRAAMSLTGEMLDHFSDPQGGFFDTSDEHEILLFRPKDIQDNATPSGNALAARALLELVHYAGEGDWRNLAEGMLRKIQLVAARHPIAFAMWLTDLDQAISPMREVAILGDFQSKDTQDLIRVLWNRYRTELYAAISPFPPPADAPVLLRDRPLVNDRATAYVCQNFICMQPVNSPQDLYSQLA